MAVANCEMQFATAVFIFFCIAVVVCRRVPILPLALALECRVLPAAPGAVPVAVVGEEVEVEEVEEAEEVVLVWLAL
jgi:hypothetical protein